MRRSEKEGGRMRIEAAYLTVCGTELFTVKAALETYAGTLADGSSEKSTVKELLEKLAPVETMFPDIPVEELFKKT